MSIDSVEEENLSKLLKEFENKKQELEILKAKTIEEIWLEELKELSTHYAIYIKNRIKRASGKIDKIKVKRVNVKKSPFIRGASVSILRVDTTLCCLLVYLADY